MEPVAVMERVAPPKPTENAGGKLVRVSTEVWTQLQAIRLEIAQEEGVILGSYAEVIQRLIDARAAGRAE
jgi:hypothetical protein